MGGGGVREGLSLGWGRPLGVLIVLAAVLGAEGPAAFAHESSGGRPAERSAREAEGGTASGPGICGRGLGIRSRRLRDECIHGRDPAPRGYEVEDRRSADELEAEAEAPGPGAGADVPCIGDGASGDRVEAIYAYPADESDRFEQIAPLIEEWAGSVSQTFDDSAAETGGSRRVSFLTPGCRLVVRRERLSAAGDDDFGATVNELSARGYNRTDRTYLVWMDSNELCGVGFVGAGFARVDNGCWGYAEAHELAHNLGAVSLSAPNSSGGWHCIDEYDRMCYSDEPDHPVMSLVCPDSHELLFDCGNDDYFSTAPPPGSFLQRRPDANIADSPFLVAEDGQRPVFLPRAPAGYSGPRYTLTLDNSDDALAAYAVGSNGERTRIFGVGLLSERRADITGALLAAARGAGAARLQIVATNKGGPRTLGIRLQRADGATLVSERHGIAGSQSSDLPESAPDPETGWTTFYDRTIELALSEPPADPPPTPSPQPAPGPTTPTVAGGGASPGGAPLLGGGPSAPADSSRGSDCRVASRRLGHNRRRAARLGRLVRTGHLRLVRRRVALRARGGRPGRAARSYRRAKRSQQRRRRVLRRLDRRVGELREQKRDACR